MNFFSDNFTHMEAVPYTLLLISAVVALGLAFGRIRFFGINFGVAGVLFSGILFGHFKAPFNPEISDFIREFGLILFVYTVGLQVGPGFFNSFKKIGIPLNLMAAFIVIAGASLTVLVSYVTGIPMAEAVGMFSGATTNTPSLAAAQQTLKQIPGISPETLKLPGLSYAVAYPFGIFGIILTMLAVKRIFKITPAGEAQAYLAERARLTPQMKIMDILVQNKNLDGIAIHDIPTLEESGVIISRIQHHDTVEVAMPDSRIYCGDVLRAVGPGKKLEAFQLVVGSPASLNIGDTSRIVVRKITVTKKKITGSTLDQLEAFLYGVTVTRVGRGDIEMPAAGDIEIRYADTLTVVGEEEAIKRFSKEVGNSQKELDHPDLIPVFIGIALGVILGSIPWAIPGIPVPVKLGLAGGPLIVSIVLSKIGKIGPVVWFMSPGANLMLREVGISLFLSCVGLRSGDRFMSSLTSGEGLIWLLGGVVVTLLPLLAVGFWARFQRKMNYLSLCGLLAGSMTDPPALAFANQLAPSNAQVIAYAAVYPVVMILRVIAAQILVILFSR